MTLTVERPLTTERDRPGSPAPTHATSSSPTTGPTPPRTRRRRMRWTALAVLLVVGLLVALIASADSAEPGPEPGATTVKLEPVDKPDPEPSTPTNASTDDVEVPTLWPFGGDEAAPACGRVPWRLACPEKTAP